MVAMKIFWSLWAHVMAVTGSLGGRERERERAFVLDSDTYYTLYYKMVYIHERGESERKRREGGGKGGRTKWVVNGHPFICGCTEQ